MQFQWNPDEKMRKAQPMPGHLQDPSVMSAALCALQEVTFRDPKPYKNVIPSFVSILKQVSIASPHLTFRRSIVVLGAHA